MKRLFQLFPLVSIFLVGADGCPSEMPGEQLVDRIWVLDSYGPSSQTPVLNGSRLTITFNDDGTCGGSGGCNSFGCAFVTDGDRIDISDLYSTEMACYPEDIMTQEQAYYRALGDSSRFDIGDNWLELYYAMGSSDGILHFHEEVSTEPARAR